MNPNQVMEDVFAKRKEYKWEEILFAFLQLEEDKDIAKKVLEFNGQMLISSDSEFPHSKSPEDMLKFLALQILGEI